MSFMLGLLLAAGTAPPLVPTMETEGISIDAPATFKVGNRSHDDVINLVEMVEPPATVDNWTRLISVVTMMGASRQADLDTVIGLWRDGYRQNCPDSDSRTSRGKVDGYRAIEVTIFCAEDLTTGKPETLTALFVQGKVNILSAQFAVRRTMTPRDYATVKQIERSVKICDSRDEACRAARPVGYLAGY